MVSSKLLRSLSKKVRVRRVSRKSRATYKVPKASEEGIFTDPNRFFKREIEKEKRSLYFE